MVLSAIACVLAVAWLGNAAMTIWLRESASLPTLRALFSFGLLLYAGWHIAKTAFFRPLSPFDWTPAERDLLAACPLRPRDLVAYQLAAVAVPTLLKTGLFALLLWPDLRNVPLGLCGILLALLLLEIVRVAAEIVTWGMSRRAFLAYRVAVVVALLAFGTLGTFSVLRDESFAQRINFGEGVLDRLVDMLVQLHASPAAYAAVVFRPFVELILARSLVAATAGWLAACAGLVAGLSVAVISGYATISRWKAIRERWDYRPAAERGVYGAGVVCKELAVPIRCLRIVPRWRGIGPLAWRQLVGARRHWGGLMTAMLVPAVLASLPCFVIDDAHIAFMSTAGALSFYTFLLLPTALRFDFRRDLDRFATLKGLPIPPAAVAVGQTLAPVLITTVFQASILMFAMAQRSLPPHLVLVTLFVLIPLNVFVFGLDNLIYLLYPYRIQQEGVEIFLRTMLTFTGKGLLFTVGLCAMSAWGFGAGALARASSHWLGVDLNPFALFAAGLVVGLTLLAGLALHGVCRTYRRLDPVEDVPR
jgi:hypothetical protein